MEIDPLSTDIDWLSLKCADFQVNVLLLEMEVALKKPLKYKMFT